MPTVNFTEREIEAFTEIFKAFEEPTTNIYMLHFFKAPGASVSIYKSGKVVFQGSNLKMFENYLKIETETFPYDEADTIGSDEVGTGDVFGPIVVSTAFVEAKDVDYLKRMGVTDSKKINDDNIIKISKKLIKKIKFKVLVVRCESFNDAQNLNNLNKMKALLHNQNITELSKLVKYDYVCLDQFCEPRKYFEYLDEKAFKDICFETKGEIKSIAVASASIISRYYFLLEMDRLEKLYSYKLPKGAGKEVDEMIAKIKKDNREDIFYHIAKLNYNNFKK